MDLIDMSMSYVNVRFRVNGSRLRHCNKRMVHVSVSSVETFLATPFACIHPHLAASHQPAPSHNSIALQSALDSTGEVQTFIRNERKNQAKMRLLLNAFVFFLTSSLVFGQDAVVRDEVR